MSIGQEQRADLDEKFEEIDQKFKERETSKLRAIKTLFDDAVAYQSGQTTKPPVSAVFGLVNAFFLSTFAILSISIVGAAVAALQIYILLSQNRLVEQQNVLIESQTKANTIEAVSSLLSGAGGDKGSESRIAQLVVYAADGYDVLNEMARHHTESGNRTRIVLARAADRLGSERAAEVFLNSLHHYTVEIIAAAGGNRLNNVRNLSFPNSSATTPSSGISFPARPPSYITMSTYSGWGPEVVEYEELRDTPDRLRHEISAVSQFSLLSQFMTSRYGLLDNGWDQNSDFKHLGTQTDDRFIESISGRHKEYFYLILDGIFKSELAPLWPNSLWSSFLVDDPVETSLIDHLRDTVAYISSICRYMTMTDQKKNVMSYTSMETLFATRVVANASLRRVELRTWLDSNC